MLWVHGLERGATTVGRDIWYRIRYTLVIVQGAAHEGHRGRIPLPSAGNLSAFFSVGPVASAVARCNLSFHSPVVLVYSWCFYHMTPRLQEPAIW